MSSIKDAISALKPKPKPSESYGIRTDYRCRAHGCPNAGSMEGDLCYWHWREKDSPEKWGNITASNRINFDTRRNWGAKGDPLPEWCR